MARLVILGSASAVSDANHDNTHMVLDGTRGALLIDCASNPLVRLARAGIPLERLTDVITTHFHPDHVYGIPILFMNSWLLGRRNPLAIYGLHHTLERIEHLMESYGWGEWPDFFPVSFHRLPERENVQVLDNEDFQVICSPSVHLVPTIALRILIKKTGRVLVYTSDTTPCDAILRLANKADLLIHESTGATLGHSSARQAGTVATKAGVASLMLIHYPVECDLDQLAAEARTTFAGPIELAADFKEYEF